MYRTAKTDLHRVMDLAGDYLRILLGSLPWMELALFGLLFLGLMLSETHSIAQQPGPDRNSCYKHDARMLERVRESNPRIQQEAAALPLSYTRDAA